MQNVTNGAGAARPESTRTIVSGASLAHRQLDKRRLAVIGADILDGRLWLQPTQQQLSALLNVSVPYVQIARALPPERRAAIMNGVDQTSFTDLMSQQRQLPLRGAKTVNGGEISDSTLAQLARRVGPQRMLNAAIAAERSALQLFKLPPAHSNGHSNGQSVISVEHPL